MSEKRYTIHKESKYKEEWYAYPFCIKEDGEVVLETIPLSIAEKVRDKLNEQQATINELKERNAHNFAKKMQLMKENEQLRILLKERQYEKDISKCREENIKLQQVLSENEKMLRKDLDMLTELRRENEQLRQQLQEKQEDEKLYAQEIVKLNKEAKEVLNFRNLGSDY